VQIATNWKTGKDRSLNFFESGGKYNPSTDSWAATSVMNAPLSRAGTQQCEPAAK